LYRIRGIAAGRKKYAAFLLRLWAEFFFVRKGAKKYKTF